MRDRLNLLDPRFRGAVAWWPLQGDAMPRHLAAPMGARSALTLPAGASFGAIPGGYGISLSGAASTTFSTVTATSLGMSGATSRTLLLEFIHKGDGTTTTQWLWGAGTASVTNQLFGVMMNLFGSHMLINCYGSGDFFFNVKPTTDDALVRLAVTYDPDAAGGTLTYYYRTLPLAGASAGIWSEGSGAKTGVALATAGSGPITLGYRQDGNYAATNAQIAYVLSIGGVAWTAHEARETLRYPDKLWQQPLPVTLSKGDSTASLSGGATDDVDASAGTINAVASLSGDATDDADTSAGTLAAVASLAGGAADAADTSTGTLAAIAGLSGDATDGADTSAGTLALLASLSGGAADGADAGAGSIATDTTPRNLSGGATDDADLGSGNLVGPPIATGGYGGTKRRAKPWHVRRPDGEDEYFDDPQAAWFRFNELYAEPASQRTKRGPRKISVGAIPARAVQFEQTDATRDFAKLAREISAQREATASARVVAQLRAIAIDAARRAADRDDEEAAMVLLMV